MHCLIRIILALATFVRSSCFNLTPSLKLRKFSGNTNQNYLIAPVTERCNDKRNTRMISAADRTWDYEEGDAKQYSDFVEYKRAITRHPDQNFLTKMKAFSGTELVANYSASNYHERLGFDNLLVECGVIRKVELTDNEAKLKIVGDQLTFIVVAEGECCSQSWFEPFAGMSFQDLVGKSVVSVKDKDNAKCSAPGRDEVDQNTLWSLVLADEKCTANLTPPAESKKKNNDGSKFKFFFRNSSNGYYGGSFFIGSCCATGSEEVYVKNVDARVVFVLGLPGSGKTTFAGTHFGYASELERHGYECVDDCLFDPMFILATKEKLERGARLILNDPRFCEVDKFEQAFNQVLRNLVSVQQISIVSFENNPAQCIKNNKKCGFGRSRDCTPAYITSLSEKYAVTLERIRAFDKCVQHQVPVAIPPDFSTFVANQ